MKKQKTFEYQSGAIEWLLNISKCFEITSAKVIRKEYRTRWNVKIYKWMVEVNYH